MINLVPLDNQLCTVTSTGMVYTATFYLMTASCILNVGNFPNDRQVLQTNSSCILCPLITICILQNICTWFYSIGCVHWLFRIWRDHGLCETGTLWHWRWRLQARGQSGWDNFFMCKIFLFWSLTLWVQYLSTSASYISKLKKLYRLQICTVDTCRMGDRRV